MAEKTKFTLEEQLLTEATATAMDEFAKTAIMEAVLDTIKDTGYITLEEAKVIENFIYKVVTEASEDFVPDEEEIEAMIKQLKALGYEVETPEEDAAEKAEAGEEEAGEGEEEGEGEGESEAEEGEGEKEAEEGEKVVGENFSLADAIARKLEIL